MLRSCSLAECLLVSMYQERRGSLVSSQPSHHLLHPTYSQRSVPDKNLHETQLCFRSRRNSTMLNLLELHCFAGNTTAFSEAFRWGCGSFREEHRSHKKYSANIDTPFLVWPCPWRETHGRGPEFSFVGGTHKSAAASSCLIMNCYPSSGIPPILLLLLPTSD